MIVQCKRRAGMEAKQVLPRGGSQITKVIPRSPSIPSACCASPGSRPQIVSGTARGEDRESKMQDAAKIPIGIPIAILIAMLAAEPVLWLWPRPCLSRLGRQNPHQRVAVMTGWSRRPGQEGLCGQRAGRRGSDQEIVCSSISPCKMAMRSGFASKKGGACWWWRRCCCKYTDSPVDLLRFDLFPTLSLDCTSFVAAGVGVCRVPAGVWPQRTAQHTHLSHIR